MNTAHNIGEPQHAGMTLRRAVLVFFTLCVLPLVAILAGASCIETPAQIAAASGYEAQQMKCIKDHKAEGKAAIDACRDDVKEAWKKPQDAGADSEGGDR